MECCDLLVDGCDVTIDRLIKQRTLRGVHLLAAAVELQSFELREFVGELVDLGVAPGNLPAAARQQGAGQLAQLLDIHGVERGGVKLRDVDHCHEVCHAVAQQDIGTSRNGQATGP